MTHTAARSNDYSQLNPALIRLQSAGPDLINGNSNHAPMVIEALCALNRAEAIEPWLDTYLPSLAPRPARKLTIDPENWQASLGHPDRFSDWSAFFNQALADTPWPQVLALWTERLMPGVCASATHGLLRTAHAARSLAQDTTPVRLAELADGLASWADTYRTITAPSTAGTKPLPSRLAIQSVAQMPAALRQPPGFITSGLAQLSDWADFRDPIRLLDTTGDLPRLWDDLAETMACLYLTNAKDGFTHIVFVHAVTSLEAARGLAYHLTEDKARTLAAYIWQTGCGLYARYGSQPPFNPRDLAFDAAPQAIKALIDSAIATQDDHVIKLTEACLRANSHRPSPAHLLAASQAHLAYRAE
jgi:hypothetical protein